VISGRDGREAAGREDREAGGAPSTEIVNEGA
jgi:hypothetical protein